MRADVALQILDWIWMDGYWLREAKMPLLDLSVTQYATSSLLDGIEPPDAQITAKNSNSMRSSFWDQMS